MNTSPNATPTPMPTTVSVSPAGLSAGGERTLVGCVSVTEAESEVDCVVVLVEVVCVTSIAAVKGIVIYTVTYNSCKQCQVDSNSIAVLYLLQHLLVSQFSPVKPSLQIHSPRCSQKPPMGAVCKYSSVTITTISPFTFLLESAVAA